MHVINNNILRAWAVSALFFFSHTIQAGGFAIIEHSVNGLGNAFAGGSASAEDSTTVYFNPAGMTLLEGTQFTAGAHIIAPSAEFNNAGSSFLGLVPLSGGDGGDAGVTKAVPNIYYVRDLTDTIKFGLGINAPFGLATEYDDNWVGRYFAVDSEIKTVNINPSLAFKATDKLSLGIGVNLQYIDAKLTNRLDAGLLAGGLGFLGLSDADAEVTGDDWSWGYNLGLMYEFSERTRLGMAYRSRIKHRLEGDAKFTDAGGPVFGAIYALQGAGAFLNEDIEADLTLPDTFSVSLYHQLNDKWAIMGDATWTHWKLVDVVTIEFDAAQGDSDLVLEWENTMRYALGLTYKHNDHWTWRFGVAYDEAPTPNANLRTPRVPEEDRTWVAAGFNYRFSNSFSLDVGYAHLFIDDANINNTDVFGHNLRGDYNASVDILSAQLNWTF